MAGIQIVMYHRVRDDLPASELITPSAVFRQQMLHLKQNYDVLSMRQLVDVYAGKKRPVSGARPQVVITFDDGYRDNYLEAFSVLKELGLPATIFLVAGMIGTNQRMKRYEMLPAPDMLSWEEATQMSAHGIVFGSHTVSHPHLPGLDYEAQKSEIEKGIETVFARTKDPIAQDVFCYPYGEYNDLTLKILKDLGVKIALTVEPGINTLSENPLQLKRVLPNFIK